MFQAIIVYRSFINRFTQSFFGFRWLQPSIRPAFNLNFSSVHKSFHKTLNGVERKRNGNFFVSATVHLCTMCGR